MTLFNDTTAVYNATLANFHTLQNSTSVYDDLAWYARLCVAVCVLFVCVLVNVCVGVILCTHYICDTHAHIDTQGCCMELLCLARQLACRSTGMLYTSMLYILLHAVMYMYTYSSTSSFTTHTLHTPPPPPPHTHQQKRQSLLLDAFSYYVAHLDKEMNTTLDYVYDWNSAFWALNVFLVQIEDVPTAHDRARSFLQTWMCSKDYYTIKGRAFNAKAPTLGATLNAAYLSVLYSKLVERTGEYGRNADQFKCWALSQVMGVGVGDLVGGVVS